MSNLRTGAERPDHTLEHAFARLPRPQKVLDLGRPLVPTKAALLRADIDTRPIQGLSKNATRFTGPVPALPPPAVLASPPVAALPLPSSIVTPPTDADVVKQTPRPEHSADENVATITLGKFTQDGVEWDVRAQRGHSQLFMVKRFEHSATRRLQRILEPLSHTNIARVAHIGWESDALLLSIEYCRFTLSEILHVHLKLEELQVQHIARSVSPTLELLVSFYSQARFSMH
jgi:hypothetical protein